MTIQEMLDGDYKIYNRFGKDEWREGTVEELETDYPFFKDYIRKINWYGANTRVAILKALNEDKEYHLYMFSEKHMYSIVIEPNYMGAILSCLYKRPMEDWTRGRDLPDGKCNEETFKRILFAILACEFVRYDDGSKPHVHVSETKAS